MRIGSLYRICRTWGVLLPLLLTLVISRAQTVVYEGTTTSLSVQPYPGHTYVWELYNDPSGDFATTPGNCPASSAAFVPPSTGFTVKINWIEPGTYFFRVTAYDAVRCAMNLKVGIVQVLPVDPKAVIVGSTLLGFCRGAQLSAAGSAGDQLSYEWTLLTPGGELSHTTGEFTEFHIPSDYSGTLPAEFQVKLKVTDIRNKTDETIITVKVDRNPSANVFCSGLYEKDGTMIADAGLSEGTGLKYNWYTNQGDIVGPANQQIAKIYGTGEYVLKIKDQYDCQDEYSFPIKFNQIIARHDYARLPWSQDTIIQILDNDNLPDNFHNSKITITSAAQMGNTKINADGTITYTPKEKKSGHDEFLYTICDEVGNCSSTTVTIDIYDSPIKAPEGFSPNGDGYNDYLVFPGLENYRPSQLYVFTRAGQLIYQSLDYQNNWDGTTSGSTQLKAELVPTGTYYYILKLGATGCSIKGFVYIGY